MGKQVNDRARQVARLPPPLCFGPGIVEPGPQPLGKRGQAACRCPGLWPGRFAADAERLAANPEHDQEHEERREDRREQDRSQPVTPNADGGAEPKPSR